MSLLTWGGRLNTKMSEKIPQIKFDQSLLRCPDASACPYVPRFKYRGFVPDNVEWEFEKTRSSFSESYKFRSNAIIQYYSGGDEGLLNVNPGFKTTKKNPYFLIKNMREGEVFYVNLKLTAYESATNKKAIAYNEILIIKGRPMNLPVLVKRVFNGRLVSSYIYERDIEETIMEYNGIKRWNSNFHKDKHPHLNEGASSSMTSLKEYTKNGKQPVAMEYIENIDSLNQDNIEFFEVDSSDLSNLSELSARDRKTMERSNNIRRVLTDAKIKDPRSTIRVLDETSQYGLREMVRYDEGRSSHGAKAMVHSSNYTNLILSKGKELLNDTLGVVNSVLGIYPSCEIECNTNTELKKVTPISKESPSNISNCFIQKFEGSASSYETTTCCDDGSECEDQAAET